MAIKNSKQYAVCSKQNRSSILVKAKPILDAGMKFKEFGELREFGEFGERPRRETGDW